MIGRILRVWILVVFVITGILGTVYIAVQQNYRQSANDPQIQMAEENATSLSSGNSVSSFNSGQKVDIGDGNLSPFYVIFDSTGNVLASQVILSGKNIVLPAGVFDYVKSHGEDRFTWQPQNGLRFAAVVTPYSTTKANGFVLAGRNLREVEKRIDMLTLEVAAGWVATIFGSLILITVLEIIFGGKRRTSHL